MRVGGQTRARVATLIHSHPRLIRPLLFVLIHLQLIDFPPPARLLIDFKIANDLATFTSYHDLLLFLRFTIKFSSFKHDGEYNIHRRPDYYGSKT